MAPQEVERVTSQLSTIYGEDIMLAQDGPRRLIRIANVDLYPECRPAYTAMLIVLDPAQPKPQVFVAPGQLLANGRLPKNSSNILIGGDTWMQFSFNIPWVEGDSVMRFMAAARQRFAQNE